MWVWCVAPQALNIGMYMYNLLVLGLGLDGEGCRTLGWAGFALVVEGGMDEEECSTQGKQCRNKWFPLVWGSHLKPNLDQ